MKVLEIMTQNPVTAAINGSLYEVAQKMMEYDCGIIPIVQNVGDKKPVGVITDRDIVGRTLAHHKNPLNMVAGEVMTNDVVAVTPENTVEECIAVMERNQIRRILVLNDAGELAGIVAQADIARIAPALETAGLVKDVSMRAAP